MEGWDLQDQVESRPSTQGAGWWAYWGRGNPPQFLVWTPAELGHEDNEGQAGEPWSGPHPPHPGPLSPAPKQTQVSWTVKEQNGRLVPSGAVLSGPINSVQFVKLKS